MMQTNKGGRVCGSCSTMPSFGSRLQRAKSYCRKPSPWLKSKSTCPARLSEHPSCFSPFLILEVWLLTRHFQQFPLSPGPGRPLLFPLYSLASENLPPPPMYATVTYHTRVGFSLTNTFSIFMGESEEYCPEGFASPYWCLCAVQGYPAGHMKPHRCTNLGYRKWHCEVKKYIYSLLAGGLN